MTTDNETIETETPDDAFVRLPGDLMESVRVVAKQNRRTFKAQLGVIIEEWLAQNKRNDG